MFPSPESIVGDISVLFLAWQKISLVKNHLIFFKVVDLEIILQKKNGLLNTMEHLNKYIILFCMYVAI